jgi:hypothetical protein
MMNRLATGTFLRSSILKLYFALSERSVLKQSGSPFCQCPEGVSRTFV